MENVTFNGQLEIPSRNRDYVSFPHDDTKTVITRLVYVHDTAALTSSGSITDGATRDAYQPTNPRSSGEVPGA